MRYAVAVLRSFVCLLLMTVVIPGASRAATLSATERANAVAFTRLLGYVQYFHPSDQAQQVNWNDFAIEGMRQALSAPDANALAATLQNAFQPVAPTVQVFPTGQRPPLPPALRPDDPTGLLVVQWHHYGPASPTGLYSSRRLAAPITNGRLPESFPSPLLSFGYGQGSIYTSSGWQFFTYPADAMYRMGVDAENTWSGLNSVQIHADKPVEGSYGRATQGYDVAAFAGKTVHFTGAIRTQDAGSATLLISIFDAASNLLASTDLSPAFPRGSTDWHTYALQASLPPNAARLYVGLVLLGGGSAWFSGLDLPELSGEPYPVVNPAEAYVADLGGGVSCSVPLALYANSQGTIPAAANPAIPWASGSIDDLPTRLAGVAETWNFFQHFSPYLDVVATDWPAALGEALELAAAAPDEPAYFNSLRALTAAARDGHATFLDRLQIYRSFNPPLTWDWIEGQLVITAVADAQGQQVARGDVVLAIDGVPTGQKLAEAERLASGATRQWVRQYALSSLLDVGPYGSSTQLLLESGGQEWTAGFTRTATPDVTSITGEPRPEPITQLAPDIMYVDLQRASNSSFDAALSRLAAARGIIFDLRGYPSITWDRIFSHLIRESISSEIFEIPINAAPDQRRRSFSSGGWTIAPAAPPFPARVVFLTDGRAISQAETDMGLAEYYRLGEIVGGPTAGTNGNIVSFTVLNQYEIVVTGMRVLKHDGSQHHGVGIQPTVPVMRTRAGVAAGRDELLERALALLQNAGSRPLGPWVASAVSGLPNTATPGGLVRITESQAGSLAGAEVDFDGQPARALYTAPDTIIATVPAELAGRTHATIHARRGGQTVFSFGVEIVPTAPEIFSADGSGRGPGAILNADGSLNSASNPAPKQSEVRLYLAGLGAADVAAVVVRIGGQHTQAGPPIPLPPPDDGIYEVRAVIPESVPSGQASVFVLAGEVPSQPGLLVNVR